MELRKIGFKQEEYNRWKQLESNLHEALEGIESESRRVMGEKYSIRDYKGLLQSPYQYLIKEFREVYGDPMDNRLDPENFLTYKKDIDKSLLEDKHKRFLELLSQMGKYAPTTTKRGLRSNLKEDQFNIYLDPEKKEEYEVLEKFIGSAKELYQNHRAGSLRHVARFHGGIFSPSGHGAEINPHLYAMK